jgi:hypothetical protein
MGKEEQGVLFVLVVIVCCVTAAVMGILKWWREHNLSRSDPAAYVMLKQMEHEAEQNKQARKWAAINTGVGIAKWFLRK